MAARLASQRAPRARLLLTQRSTDCHHHLQDERGREVKPPGGGAAHRARASHVSSELLVLRPEAAAASYAVFTKLGKGKLRKELDDYSVDTEMFIGPKA